MEDQRICIKFCVKNGFKGAENFWMLQTAYGDAVMSRRRVFEWYKRFKEGRKETADKERSGRPPTSTTPEKVDKVLDLNARKETASLNFEATTDDPELLKRVITGDETWIYGFDSETIQQASEWCFKNEPRPKKARKAPSKVKVMLTVFFDYQGIVHHVFKQQGSTITADSYLGVLRRLRDAIRQKRPELSTPISTVSIPRRKIRAHYEHMSKFETGRAIGLKEAGWSNRLIARHLCRSDAAIRRCLQKWFNNGSMQRQDGSGRPRATTEREDKTIVRMAVAAPESLLSTIQRVTGTQVFEMTINRRLRERNLRFRRPLRCLPLTPVHRQVRLQWCRERSTWNCADWGRIVFSDESRFLLCPDDRRKRVWRRPGQRVDPGLTVEHHTGPQQGVMVWGAISFDSRTPLVVIPGTLTAQRYVDDILRPALLPFLSHHPGLTFQQDNARPHTARVTMDCLHLAELFRGQQDRLISRP
ncbi:hypothetical protein LAZ67_2001908 [Cordylochernes scorpioides]|uniref:Transposase Tc1-like domain-containing protein n=1 Tax=Cordylochernes scorpioides TaxID=51811 RepID=A0ABY6K1V5_9ARAC|nr:hypothetical protein LAZ67_2001908 [Cordylochernes scorpioides]